MQTGNVVCSEFSWRTLKIILSRLEPGSVIEFDFLVSTVSHSSTAPSQCCATVQIYVGVSQIRSKEENLK